jgi:iron complex transport system permease protein
VASPRPAGVIVAGVALTALAAAVSLTVGVVDVPLGDVVRALAGAVGLDGSGAGDASRALIVDMRLPRAVGAVCVGAALGTAGAMLQALLRNPLASPTVIGTSQAAAFGKVLGVYLGLGSLGAISTSFAAACGGALLVLSLARTRAGLPAISVVLMGINMSLFFAALTGLVVFISRDENQLGRMALMLAGGLWQVTWSPLAVIGPATLVVTAAALAFARPLDLLALGESDAKRLGVNVARTGTVVLLVACLLTSLAVCLAGVVAFVGLVVPHAARRIVGPAHSALVPASAALGAVLVVATDTLARSIAPPYELPLGVMTSLVGVPCFVAIVRSMQKRSGEA